MYKAGYVTTPNYIAELIITKRNEFYNNGRSGESFWNQQSKRGGYGRLLAQINRMLKLYSAHSIIKTIQSSKCVGKIHYHHSWDDDKFQQKNKTFFAKIEEFEKNATEKDMVRSYNNNIPVGKKFGCSKNILKDL